MKRKYSKQFNENAIALSEEKQIASLKKALQDVKPENLPIARHRHTTMKDPISLFKTYLLEY